MSSRATIDDSFSPSVLLVRLDAIGDALATTPLVAALSSAGIPVDLVLSHANFDALSKRASRNRFAAPFALRSASKDRHAIETFARQIRANRYSHTLVATEDAGGYELARLVGSPVRTGFTNGWGKPLKTLWLRTILTTTRYRPAGLDARGRNECDVLFTLGSALLGGAKPSRDAHVLRPFVLDSDVPRGDSIVVQITDKWDRLGIAFDDVVRVLRLAGTLGPVRAISAANEMNYATRVTLASGIPVERLDTLTAWKCAIAAGRALIAPDSGAIHVAGMVGTPTIAVFPAIARLARQTARWAPWAAPSETIAAAAGWPERAATGLRKLLLETGHSVR